VHFDSNGGHRSSLCSFSRISPLLFFPEIVQEVIKEIAQTAPVIGAKAKMGFKLVVLNEVERLSKPAQHALRRTMEKYMATCRFDLRK